MLSLALAIICTTLFSLIVRHTQRAGQDQLAVMGLNYAAASAAGFLIAGNLQIAPQTWLIGILGGVIFVTCYLLFIHSLDLKGVAIANAVTRLSVVIPVLGTIFVFGETPHAMEAVGAAVAIAAMPLLSLDRGVNGSRLTRRQVPLLLALFVMNGCCLLVNKWFQAVGLEAQRPAFLGVLFGTAAAVSAVAWAATSRRSGWQEVSCGVPLGVINFGTSFMLIRALDELPGTVVFPVVAALGLVLTSGFAAWAWREVPGRMGQVGLALALVAVVLVKL